MFLSAGLSTLNMNHLLIGCYKDNQYNMALASTKSSKVRTIVSSESNEVNVG